MAFLTFEDVYKSYGDEQVLRGIDLSMDEREVVVVIGPSGSGKSTLLTCVNRLTEIDSGTIRLDGESIADIDTNDLRRRVGMVFQDFNLFAHLTARGNVTLGLRKVRGFSRPEATQRADDTLARVGLSDQADSYPGELSGGQQQRVSIARALAMEPDLLLFDEPTSALDPELVGDVLAVMKNLAQEGMTMLCASHEMGFAREVADRIVFLDEGHVVEEGPPTQLFLSPESERTREFLGRITGGHDEY